MRPQRILEVVASIGLVIVSGVCSSQIQAQAQNSRQSALALEQQGKVAESEAAWRALLKAHPGSAEAYAHLGLLEARQEHYSEAVPLYRKALTLSPSLPGVRLNLGLALFKSNSMKEAIQQFTLLLKAAAPDSPEAQRLSILIGMAHYADGQFADAAVHLKRAAARDPQNLSLLLSLAHSCLWSKQYQCVLDTYHEIISLNAESAEADMLAGEALDEMKDTPAAIQQFRAAAKANPNEPDVHFGLGYLLWKEKHYEEATQEFHAELANNPKQMAASVHLADAEMRMGHTETAMSLLEAAVRQDSSQALAHLDLGILYADAGRNEDALRELTEAEKLTPDDVNVHWRLGRLYRTMGRKEEAKAELQKASSITKAADNALAEKMQGGHRAPAAEEPSAGGAAADPKR